MNLSQILTALHADPDGAVSLEIPEDWQQGRTLYGGLNAALAVEVARRSQDDLGPLQALQIAFMAPAAGRVRYVPSLLRGGRSVSFLGVDTFAADTLCSRTILTFARPRESDLRHVRVAAPEVPEPEASRTIPYVEGTTPTFFQHFEVAFASGAPPLSGGEPEFSMWVRHRDGEDLAPEIALIAVADVLPPALVASRREFHPGSSITWSLDVAEVPDDPAAWYLMRTTSDQAADGYSAQAMSCFGRDGRLAAVSRQTVASF